MLSQLFQKVAQSQYFLTIPFLFSKSSPLELLVADFHSFSLSYPIVIAFLEGIISVEDVRHLRVLLAVSASYSLKELFVFTQVCCTDLVLLLATFQFLDFTLQAYLSLHILLMAYSFSA